MEIKSFIRENKSILIFLIAAVAVSIVLATFVSPFASSSPDGLEKVAEDKGFGKKAEEKEPAWRNSPVPDYVVGGEKNEDKKWATGLAGFIGVLITIAVTLMVCLIVRGIRAFSREKSPVE
ncbi:MAG: PDGLE domain-containing protein [Actinomycetota bacterium]|nr:PDGLE domain-containing protein [Actinomycetota bacterium]